MPPKRKNSSQRPPAEGERQAQRGYQKQYAASASAIYQALMLDELEWLGLADRKAGVVDDLVLGLSGKVVGHQFKTSHFPARFNVSTLLLGAENNLQKLASSWQELRSQFPGSVVEVRFITTDYAHDSDHLLGKGAAHDHSAAFIAELRDNPERPLAEWQASKWWPFVEKLRTASGLDELQFEPFIQSLRLVCGHQASFLATLQSDQTERGVREIAQLIPRLIAQRGSNDRWTRDAFLAELKWPDDRGRRHSHKFPIGAHVQRNLATEKHLLETFSQSRRGYVSLLGPPGSGKSTLIQIALSSTSERIVIRYFAFLPGEGHGLGRAEAEDFLSHLINELRKSGLQALRVYDTDLRQMQEHLQHLIKGAGARYQDRGVATIVVIDGLDHIPREEKPERSLLNEMPLPAILPAGVIFVLGSQHLNLDGLPRQVIEEASRPDRCVSMEPLPKEAIFRFADETGLDATIDRNKLYKLTDGHPLAARYLIEALKAAPTETARSRILDEEFEYAGDIARVYDSAWRDVEADSEVRRILAYLARVEGTIDPELLSNLVNRQAAERAYKATGHLLTVQAGRWRVFHNSFRLYLLGKEERPFGKRDEGLNSRLYIDLAQLAANSSDPQRWLELRYRSRAGQAAEVLKLATPQYLRAQLAQGRSARDIQADIRLAFQATATTLDTGQLIRLLLSRHEIGMRAEALRYSSNLVDAYLTFGDLDTARALIDEGITTEKAFDILDAFTEAGRIDDARRLFDELEPLAEAGTNYASYNDLEPWARRAFRFRQADQLRAELKRLEQPRGANEWHKQEAKDLVDRLRFDISISTVDETPAADIDTVAKELELPDRYASYLKLRAALSAFRDNDATLAIRLLDTLKASKELDALPSNWRRAACRLALQLDQLELAQSIFASLDVPVIADRFSGDSKEELKADASEILEHAALAAELNLPAPKFSIAKDQTTTTFQVHLSSLGAISGHARRGDTSNLLHLNEVAKNLLTFLDNVAANDASAAYQVAKVRGATPLIVTAILRTATFYGQSAFDAIAQSILDLTSEKQGNLRQALAHRREIIRIIFDRNRDADAAANRLEAAYKELGSADTPSEQVDEIAGFALSFAHIGKEVRAREILADIHLETLGYSLAPKKDPQYVFWRDAFLKACGADPRNRVDRVRFMTRLLVGMGRTEGRATAYRLAAPLLDQAAIEGPAAGAAVSTQLEKSGLVSWETLVDSQLRGVLARRPDLTMLAAQAWISLVLPYYQEPYYHDSRTGEFVEQALLASSEASVGDLIQLLLPALEAQAVPHVRVELLEKLLHATKARGAEISRIENALTRWRKEAPPKDGSSTQATDPLEAANSLDELSSKIDASDQSSHLTASSHVARLAGKASSAEIESFVGMHPEFEADSKVRFARVRAALGANNLQQARSLLAAYRPEQEHRASWDTWMGGAKLEHHKLLVELDGASARQRAFTEFANDLSHGREFILSLITDLDEIVDVITPNPDWPSIWQSLQDLLTQFREYALGDDLDLSQGGLPKSEEELIASLYEQAFSLRLADLAYQARVGATASANVTSGIDFLAHLIDRLLRGDDEGPLEAAGLLYQCRHNKAVADRFADRISDLAEHPDFGVQQLIKEVASQWGVPLNSKSAPLPGFYSLVFDNESEGERYRPPAKIAGQPETAWISSPLDWTWPLEFHIGLISDCSGISHMHLRQRTAQIINAAGGVVKYGPATEKDLRRRLDRVDMAMTFRRPVLSAATAALRRVVGELALAKHVNPGAYPYLLHELGSPIVRDTLPIPSPRPDGIVRPSMQNIGYTTQEETWLNGVGGDLVPIDVGGKVLLAETALFQDRSVIRTATVSRVRLHGASEAPWKDLDEALQDIPSVIGFKPVTMPANPSPHFVRRLSNATWSGPPQHILLFCPKWAERLRWTQHPDNPLIYRDQNGSVMVSVIWWRDGGPRHVRDAVLRGEGSLVLLSPEGARQLGAIAGPLKLVTSCVRSLGREGREDQPKVKRASKA
jgi:hypothetical protein